MFTLASCPYPIHMQIHPPSFRLLKSRLNHFQAFWFLSQGSGPLKITSCFLPSCHLTLFREDKRAALSTVQNNSLKSQPQTGQTSSRAYRDRLWRIRRLVSRCKVEGDMYFEGTFSTVRYSCRFYRQRTCIRVCYLSEGVCLKRRTHYAIICTFLVNYKGILSKKFS